MTEIRRRAQRGVDEAAEAAERKRLANWVWMGASRPRFEPPVDPVGLRNAIRAFVQSLGHERYGRPVASGELADMAVELLLLAAGSSVLDGASAVGRGGGGAARAFLATGERLGGEGVFWRPDSGQLGRLRRWFAEARRVLDGMDDTLPMTDPPLVWRTSHPIEGDGGLVRLTGWFYALEDRLADAAVRRSALIGGCLAERRFMDAMAERAARLREQAEAMGASPEVLAGMEAQLAEGQRQAVLLDWWREQRLRAGTHWAGVGRDRPSILAPAVPWWEVAAAKGKISAAALQEVKTRIAVFGWSPASFERAEGSGAVDEPLLAALGRVGGEETAARLARLALRLERCKPGAGGGLVGSGYALLEAPAVAGDPDPRRVRTRVLTARERARLFEGLPQVPGSAGEHGFALPVGSVMVITENASAYLRGRGWRIAGSGELVAWDWRGEGVRMPVGGLGGPGRDADGRRNLSPVPFQTCVYAHGMRWWNIDGGGVLFDETDGEWEDRRLRIRALAWEALRAGPLTPGQWCWVAWSLIGPVDGPATFSPGAGEWCPPRPSGGVLGDAIAYRAGWRTEPREWNDAVNFARRWGRELPEGLREHAVHRALERREGGETDCYVSRLARVVADGFAADPGRRAAFDAWRDEVLGPGGFAGFWERVEGRRAFDQEQQALYQAEVEEHRAWKREYTRLVEVQAEGELEVVPWDELAFPEGLRPPACMEIPLMDGPGGFDFESLELDQQLNGGGVGGTAGDDEPIAPEVVGSLPGTDTSDAAWRELYRVLGLGEPR